MSGESPPRLTSERHTCDPGRSLSSIQDDRQQFAEERERRLSALDLDDPIWSAAGEFFNQLLPLRYSYNFEWLGLPIIQYPQDIVAMQELCWSVKPDLIIETGVARGGSVIFYASMLRLLGGEGLVLGIDIDIRAHNRESIERHPLSEHVRLIDGSSTSDEVVGQVAEYAQRAQRTMVVLDSNHTKDHVARELELYAPFVGKGSYIVVFDTVVETIPADLIGERDWAKGNSPANAVDEFLQRDERFVIDRSIDAKLLISAAPRGYLKCVQDPG
jgi:cephalosporin hydroxylase